MTRALDDVIVVERVEEGDGAMEPMAVPVALKARIGYEATLGLTELLESRGRMWSDQAMNLAAERFESRLTEELLKFRVAITQEIATTRVDMLRWSFVFWIGQVAAMAALMALMLRGGQ